MEKYYFTFGPEKTFPYQNTYLIVAASSYNDAVKSFREKYPDLHPDCMNCSSCYNEKEWGKVGENYTGQGPAEIIWTEICFGKKPEGYDEIYIFVPEERQIIRIEEGGGDNLTKEDIENGCVDYIYYDQYELNCGISEDDGGEILLKEPFRDKYKCTADCIPDVLDMAYGINLLDCIILM